MIQRKLRIATLLYASVESVITLLSFLAAYIVRASLHSEYFGQLFPFRDYIVLLVVVIILWSLLFALIRTRKPDFSEDWIEVIQEVALTVFAGTVLIAAAIFVLKFDFI